MDDEEDDDEREDPLPLLALRDPLLLLPDELDPDEELDPLRVELKRKNEIMAHDK